MKALIIDNHSKFIQRIGEILDHLKIDHSSVDFADFQLNMSDSFDCFILSGGSLSIGGTPAFKEEKELIKQAPKPVFGMCFGFQLISFVYGEITEKLQSKISGVNEIDVFGFDKLGINYNKKKLKVFESHLWAIKKPPKDFDVYGTSQYGIEIIKHSTKPIFATQFHPEVREGNNGSIILQYFLQKMVMQK
ncbi:MAG: gamma-glutamyl-gamma-aminobutyrate hydrolase family protein [Candidatus Cloacimonetes bacterium]|nr:gamma-glutamyl-gamma-aminobutyrate hydrolase family protein [Candidatus Cloacimonadota bacterium]